VVVVTGHDHERVGAHLEAMARDLPRLLLIVHAADHAEGMAASLRAGIGALDVGTEGVFVFLGDMPDIPAALPSRLAQAIGDRPAAAPAFEGERGHPVLFKRNLFPSLSALSGDRGARALLDRLGDDLVIVECDSPGVLFDVDHRRDLTF
jgi:molybdenum cofactor cytidylyltransferase